MAVTTPVTIYTGNDVSGPSDPVRIANWSDLVSAIVTAIGSGGDNQFDSIQFNTSYAGPAAHSEGLAYWNPNVHTLNVMTDVPGTILQIGQEFYMYVHNNTGAQIANAKAVYISGSTGDRMTIALARADSVATSYVIGLTTAIIPNNSNGWITLLGAVNNANTNAWNQGDLLYLSPTTAGELTNVEPSQPNFSVKVGWVQRKSATIGSIHVGGQQNVYVDVPVVMSEFIEINARNLDEQLHGGFGELVTGSALNNGAPINYTHGLGKIFIVLNAGADFDGTITVTGDTVDRNTGAITVADTENITIDALTTDNSDLDAQGNMRHAFTGAYITNKWFRGAVTISTADTNFTDVDIYNISFEQVNDTASLEFDTFDISLFCNNTLGWFYSYTYLVNVNPTTKKCNISRVSSLELAVGVTTSNRRYRLRNSNIGQALDGRYDGFWCELFFGPTPQQYFESVTIKHWFNVRTSLK